MLRRRARAPRLSSLSAVLIFSTVLCSISTSAISQTSNQYIVCKEPDSLVCLAWPIDSENATVTRELYESDERKCGISDLRPIPPHRKFIAVRWFNDTISRNLFCKTTKVKILAVPFELNVKRLRRQTSYHPRGRYRGQTQSQYLSIDRGNGKDEGKAEAHSAADSSRAVVSGNSGMGQAQSQTIYDPSCEDCLDHTGIDAANLSYKPGQIPSIGTNGKTPGGSYVPRPSTGGSYGPGQISVGSVGPGEISGGAIGPSPGSLHGPGQISGRPGQFSPGVYGPDQTSGGRLGSGQSPGNSVGGAPSPGNSIGIGQTPGRTYEPNLHTGGSYGQDKTPGSTYNTGQGPGSNVPNQPPDGFNRPGQTPGGMQSPGGPVGGINIPGQTQPGGTSTFVTQPAGIYNGVQTPGGTYGHGPGGSYVPGQSSGGYGPTQPQPQPGSFSPGQTTGGSYIPGQSLGGTNGQGQTYVPGRPTFGTGQLQGGSYSPGQQPGLSILGHGQTPGGSFTPEGPILQGHLPGGPYAQGTLPGGTTGTVQGTYTPTQVSRESLGPGQATGGYYPQTQTPGTQSMGAYDPGQSTGGHAPYAPGQLTEAQPTGRLHPQQGNNAGQIPGSTISQLNGPGNSGFGGSSIQPGAQGINWPLLSNILPGVGAGSTYFCCVVNPGNNGGNPSNTYFGIPGSATSNNNFGVAPYNTGTTGTNNILNPPSSGSFGTTRPADQATFQNSGAPMGNGYNAQPQLQNANTPYGPTSQGNLPGNGVTNNLQTPNVSYGQGGQSNIPTRNGPYVTGQNIPLGSTSGPGNLQSPNIPNRGDTSGQNVPFGNINVGQNGLGSFGNYDPGKMGQSPSSSSIPGRIGQTNLQYPDGSYVTGGTGQNVPYATGTSNLNGNYIPGRTGGSVPNIPYGTGNVGENGILPGTSYGTGKTGQNSVYGPIEQGQSTLAFPNGQYGAGNIGPNTLHTPNGMSNGLQNTGVIGNGDQNLRPTNLQSPSNTYGPEYSGQNLGLNGQPSTNGQYSPVKSGQNIPALGGTYGPGNGGQNLGQFGPDSNNLMIPNNYGSGQPGVINQQGGINNSMQGSDQNNVGLTNGNGGIPQNVLDPNAIAGSFDDYDSEAQASVAQSLNGTTALAASKGGNKKGRAQTQVEGTYTGTGSFSANAEISDDNKAAQSHVSGSKKGANSNAEGRGRKNKSQASVQLGSETGSILTDSQSSGDSHSSGSQVQGSVKGGMADAQAKGPGSTSSQAQIGFTPYKEQDKVAHDKLKTPFEGGGSASAQTSGRMGTSQSQLRGTFKYGITYNGAAQAGSSLDKDAVFSNLVPFEKIDVYDENNKNINIEATTTENQKEVTETITDKYEETTIVDTHTDETKEMSDHSHSDHHKSSNQQNSTTRPPPEGNRRSFTPSYNTNTGDYDYSTDKDDNQQEDYDIDDGYGTDPVETGPDQNEYSNYDEINRDTENTHQALQSASKKELEVKQTTGGNMQHIILGSLNNHDARVIQKNSEHPDESKVYQAGERVPGMGGYTIPVGFTGSVKSVASKDKTYVVGSKYSPSQAQTVTLTPGTGKIKYVYPNRYRQNVHPKDLRSLYNTKSDDNRYVSVSKSVTRDLDNEDNVRRQYSHTYYTKSSSCGYFTFTCTMVSSAEGKKKVCKPKIPRNPDGSPMNC